MHRFFTLAALLFAATVQAQVTPLTPQQKINIVAHCECEMSGTGCILVTQRPMATETKFVAGGMVSIADQNYLTLAGPKMCETGKREIEANSTSPRSRVFRSRFRQAWAGPCPYPVAIKQPTK